MLRPVSPRVYRTLRRHNRLPAMVRFTSSSEVSLPQRISLIFCAYGAKVPSKYAFELPDAPSVAYAAATHPLPGPAPSSRTRETVALANDYILPVYVRPPFVLERGKGSWVWDCDGRKYLDFTAGIAVNALGHADEGVSEASLRHFAPHPCPGNFISDRRI
jgi:acetylornithine aminotransferase